MKAALGLVIIASTVFFVVFFSFSKSWSVLHVCYTYVFLLRKSCLHLGLSVFIARKHKNSDTFSQTCWSIFKGQNLKTKVTWLQKHKADQTKRNCFFCIYSCKLILLFSQLKISFVDISEVTLSIWLCLRGYFIFSFWLPSEPWEKSKKPFAICSKCQFFLFFFLISSCLFFSSMKANLFKDKNSDY